MRAAVLEAECLKAERGASTMKLFQSTSMYPKIVLWNFTSENAFGLALTLTLTN